MRRNKNCKFKNRIENIFAWKNGGGTFVSNYTEDREKGVVDFDVEGQSVTYPQIKMVARLLATQDVTLVSCGGGYEDDTYLNIEIHGAKFD